MLSAFLLASSSFTLKKLQGNHITVCILGLILGVWEHFDGGDSKCLLLKSKTDLKLRFGIKRFEHKMLVEQENV